ncbi:hypothetical protein WN51_13389 [Melipona quadrifasciata]|uniref:Uncharacterized protein n=1 Tax=Melipona quadrifasciata TaxID=166423 RepID=A0A0N0U5J0_9HYME|nr:hypothetical protein WN51_13389 [Melipona quadrifasciata]
MTHYSDVQQLTIRGWSFNSIPRLRGSSTKLVKVVDPLDAFQAVVRGWMREKQNSSTFDLSPSENERVHDFITQSEMRFFRDVMELELVVSRNIDLHGERPRLRSPEYPQTIERKFLARKLPFAKMENC